MASETWGQWQERIASLEALLDQDPENADLARRLWSALDVAGKYNAWSGARALAIFRAPAISSADGVVALADAFMELWLVTGEPPRGSSFDEELRSAIARASDAVGGDQKRRVQWLLKRIG